MAVDRPAGTCPWIFVQTSAGPICLEIPNHLQWLIGPRSGAIEVAPGIAKQGWKLTGSSGGRSTTGSADVSFTSLPPHPKASQQRKQNNCRKSAQKETGK